MASSSMSKFFSCLLIIKLSVVELTVLIFDVRLLLIWHNNVSVLFAEFCNVSFVECVLKVINKKIIGNTATMTNSRISFDLRDKLKQPEFVTVENSLLINFIVSPNKQKCNI